MCAERILFNMNTDNLVISEVLQWGEGGQDDVVPAVSARLTRTMAPRGFRVFFINDE